MARDIADYTDRYRNLPFEPIQASMRRALVLRRIACYAPRALLEVGCGHASLLTDLIGTAVTVIEPSAVFAAHARSQAADRTDVHVVEGTVEDYAAASASPDFDMIVVSSLLHEVADAQSLLAVVRGLCGPQTVVHVNVPNARSLHRLLAVSMGLIANVTEISDTQRTMQQHRTYDQAALDTEMAQAGFTVTDRGSLFVKPFTHAQMQRLVDEGFMTPAMLEGLDKLVQWLPDLGSEIWVDAKLA